MALFQDMFPWTNIHELNLDWILAQLKKLAIELDNFVALNTIKYADPIQWNIGNQYPMNTVVVDPITGNAYLSVQPVPTGVPLTNTDYWTLIFNLDLLSANQNLTLRDDGANILASFSSDTDDWLIWNGILYKVSQPINVNEAYVVGYNLDRYTVEQFIKDYIQALTDMIGDLNDLNTTDKTNLVNAINEIYNLLAPLIPNYIAVFDNVSDMINADLSAYQAAITKGYYSVNDGGGALYSIEDTAPATYYETNIGNKYCELIVDGTINIKQLGAKADNATDISAALQYAVNNYEAVYIPKGTYLVSNAVTVNRGDSIIIYGDGEKSILHGVDIFIMEMSADHMSTIKDIKFTNSDTAISGEAIHLGTSVGGVLNLTISGCYFYYCYYAILMETEVDKLHITNCYFYRTIKSSFYCDHADSTHAGIYIDACHFQACDDGCNEIDIVKTIALNITNCIFQTNIRTNVKYIRLRASHNIVMVNNYFETLGNDAATTNKVLDFNGVRRVTIDTVELSGNVGGIVLGTHKSAFDFNSCSEISISHVYYTHTLLDQLISMAGVHHISVDFINSTVPTTDTDHIRDFTEMIKTNGTELSKIRPGYMATETNIANGSSITATLYHDALGYSQENAYLITVAIRGTAQCGLYIMYRNAVTAMSPITGISVSSNDWIITVTNNTGSTIATMQLSVLNLTNA